MCRSTSELWVAVGGTSAAGVVAMLRLHWDMLRDRKAWREAAKRSNPDDEEGGEGANSASEKHR